MALFSSGMRLTPARLNFVRIARQTADQSVTNSTTLTDASGLSLTGIANEVYEVAGRILYEAPTANDFKFALTWTSGTLPWGMVGLVSTATGVSGDVAPTAFGAPSSGAPFTAGGAGASNQLMLLINGTWSVGGATSTLKFQFAEFTAGAATSATLKAGSLLKLTRIA